jgi:hypothetical protein
MFGRLIKDKRLTKIVVTFAIAILVFGAWLYFHSKITGTSQEPVLNTYYNQDYKYSLVMPSDWLGRYMADEIKKGDTVFIYLGDGKTMLPIFILSVLSDSQWLGQKNSLGAPQYIAENGGYVYTYSLVDDSNSLKNLDKSYADEFLNMSSEVKNIVKTIKFSQ